MEDLASRKPYPLLAPFDCSLGLSDREIDAIRASAFGSSNPLDRARRHIQSAVLPSVVGPLEGIEGLARQFAAGVPASPVEGPGLKVLPEGSACVLKPSSPAGRFGFALLAADRTHSTVDDLEL